MAFPAANATSGEMSGHPCYVLPPVSYLALTSRPTGEATVRACRPFAWCSSEQNRDTPHVQSAHEPCDDVARPRPPRHCPRRPHDLPDAGPHDRGRRLAGDRHWREHRDLFVDSGDGVEAHSRRREMPRASSSSSRATRPAAIPGHRGASITIFASGFRRSAGCLPSRWCRSPWARAARRRGRSACSCPATTSRRSGSSPR